MSRGRQPAPPPPAPARGRRLLAAGLLLAAGCLGDRAFDNDPLTGGPALRRPVPAPAPTPLAPRPGEAGPPPLPPPQSSTSQAALTAAAPQPADNGRDLRI